MHNYSIDTDCRKKAIVFIMIISFLLNSFLYHPINLFIDFIGDKISIISYLTVGRPKKEGSSATIKQDWNKISIKCKFGESSSSYSKTASLYVDDIEGVMLTFTYINDSKNPNWEARKHDGCNIFHCGDGVLDGKYFTDRGNGTHGTIQLMKTEPIDEKINLKKEFQLK